MSETILVVDDEPRYRDLISAYLEQSGYRVVTAVNGKDALFVARDAKPSLILLDIMMPELDGHEFMRLHRRERETPIILLTAKVEEEDKVIGLELGADDYVTKPFSPRELLARVKAVLRRTKPKADGVSTTTNLLQHGPLTIDLDHFLFTIDGETVDLTRSEFEILAALMGAKKRAFSRLELLERIQGDTFEGYERTIDAHVKNLRAKIEPNPRKPIYIETVYGVGYRFKG